MPIYEYRCLHCGKVSEIFLRSPDSEDVECPICGRTERCEMPLCSLERTCRRE